MTGPRSARWCGITKGRCTASRARVEAHLKGCDWCERFGREMSGVVAGLRKQLAEDEAVDEGVAARLMERLALE
ncbi:MAG: hypothetical protein RMA76_03865 [Deltaproteobacteria bacterium]